MTQTRAFHSRSSRLMKRRRGAGLATPIASFAAAGFLVLSWACANDTAEQGVSSNSTPSSAESARRPSPIDTGSVDRQGRDVQFVFDESYSMGQLIEVRIRNFGQKSYQFNASSFAACELFYSDSRGREFIIPPGMHCDLVLMDTIQPGETVTLFQWGLDECIQDSMGNSPPVKALTCQESKPLPPGAYTVKGRFGTATFTIC